MLRLGLIVALLCFTQAWGEDSEDGKITLTTEMIVKRHGFPFEKHEVNTQDGYVLEMHRIPRSNPNKVVFLMHDILGSSSDFCILGPKNSLAFMLAYMGYDVWMGNARGNFYSRNNVNFEGDISNDKSFWDFSWHEIGTLDLPAMLYYVRNETEAPKISYVGFSQGATTALVLNSMKPEFNDIFKSVHLLAPVAFLGNTSNIYMKLVGSVITNAKLIQMFVGKTEINPDMFTVQFYGGSCPYSEDWKNRVLLKNPMFLASCLTVDTVNSTAVPDIMISSPAGSSVKQALHWVQLSLSGKFRQYDLGVEGNLETYKSVEPPDYPLEKITAPLYVYHSQADITANVPNIKILTDSLSTVVKKKLIELKGFDHLAFMYAADLSEKMNHEILKDIEDS